MKGSVKKRTLFRLAAPPPSPPPAQLRDITPYSNELRNINKNIHRDWGQADCWHSDMNMIGSSSFIHDLSRVSGWTGWTPHYLVTTVPYADHRCSPLGGRRSRDRCRRRPWRRTSRSRAKKCRLSPQSPIGQTPESGLLEKSWEELSMPTVTKVKYL